MAAGEGERGGGVLPVFLSLLLLLLLASVAALPAPAPDPDGAARPRTGPLCPAARPGTEPRFCSAGPGPAPVPRCYTRDRPPVPTAAALWKHALCSLCFSRNLGNQDVVHGLFPFHRLFIFPPFNTVILKFRITLQSLFMVRQDFYSLGNKSMSLGCLPEARRGQNLLCYSNAVRTEQRTKYLCGA